MTSHKIGTRQEWLAARLELPAAEKALTRRSDELARMQPVIPPDAHKVLLPAIGPYCGLR